MHVLVPAVSAPTLEHTSRWYVPEAVLTHEHDPNQLTSIQALGQTPKHILDPTPTQNHTQTPGQNRLLQDPKVMQNIRLHTRNLGQGLHKHESKVIQRTKVHQNRLKSLAKRSRKLVENRKIMGKCLRFL
jgi:hypothetical protein